MPSPKETTGVPINGSWKAEALSAAIKQGPSFIVLILILYGLWYFGDYAITTAVPAHLRQIQEGYQNIESQQSQDIERLTDSWEKQLKQGEVQLEINREINRSLQESNKTVQMVIEEIKGTKRDGGM